MNYTDELKRVFLFKDLPPGELAALAKVAREHSLMPRETLFSEGQKGDEFFVIVHGSARVLKKNDAGDPEEVTVLGTGSYFGEIAFINTVHKRTATIETVEHTVALGFKRDDVLKILNQNDKLAHHFYRALAEGLALRLEATTGDAAHFKAIALRHA